MIERTVLISGASVAGPVLAYWLKRHGFEPTVVERAPELRHGLGGHAVDLFGPAVDVADRMGLLAEVVEARTRTDRMTLVRRGRRPMHLDMARLTSGLSDRHVEIMRGELTKLFYEATRNDVEYLFGDSIASLSQDAEGVDVTFDHGEPRRFALVVGADGLHSNVRRLAFGAEGSVSNFLGGYLGVYTMPNSLGLAGDMLMYPEVDRIAGTYGVHQTGEARALFLFRRHDELKYDYRDVEQQKRLLREEFAQSGPDVSTMLEHLDKAEDFYFDSISQITLDSWHRGRIALVGDAGYSPGPAVGGGTSLAVVTAYVLAGELAASYGDPAAGLRAYENRIREYVVRSREIGPAMLKTLVPRSQAQLWFTAQAIRIVTCLPAGVQRRLSGLNQQVAKTLESVTLDDYPAIRESA